MKFIVFIVVLWYILLTLIIQKLIYRKETLLRSNILPHNRLKKIWSVWLIIHLNLKKTLSIFSLQYMNALKKQKIIKATQNIVLPS